MGIDHFIAIGILLRSVNLALMLVYAKTVYLSQFSFFDGDDLLRYLRSDRTMPTPSSFVSVCGVGSDSLK